MSHPSIAFGILHATFREKQTLTDCIASLYDAGVDDPQVFSDDGYYGSVFNLRRAIILCARRSHHYVCVVDDDLRFYKGGIIGTLQKIEEDAHPPALTLWTIEQNIPHEMRDNVGWIKAPVSMHTWGGAVVMRKDIAWEVAKKMGNVMMAPELEKSPDGTLYETLKQLKVPVLHHIPSMCTHVGLEGSTIGNDHSRNDTVGFRFDEWPADEHIHDQ